MRKSEYVQERSEQFVCSDEEREIQSCCGASSTRGCAAVSRARDLWPRRYAKTRLIRFERWRRSTFRPCRESLTHSDYTETTAWLLDWTAMKIRDFNRDSDSFVEVKKRIGCEFASTRTRHTLEQSPSKSPSHSSVLAWVLDADQHHELSALWLNKA